MRLSPYQKYRILEMIPAVAAWTTLIGAVVLSFVEPLLMVYVAILFDLYWLLRVWYFIIYLSVSWNQYRKNKAVHWMGKVRELEDWESYYHLVFFPTVDEDITILRHSFDGLVNSDYPTDKMIVVLAGEERQQEHFEAISKQIEQEYAHHFKKLLSTLHPADIPGEIAAKGANLHWAGYRALEYVDEVGLPHDKVIVSSFDVDTVVDPQYFSYLSYSYITHPNPTRSSYQPLAVYNNNVWESFSFTRVVANSTTFWLMAELSRPKPLWTFSSHAMSLTALVDVGFWQSDIVTEDSRIFLQCYLHYDGDYEVTPLYIPVSMDTAHGGTFWRSVKNLYKQQRRWAWGIEHFPFMIWHFTKNRLNPRKWMLFFNLTEGMYSWATAPLLILLLGYIPLWALGDQEQATVVAQTAPLILEWLMRFATAGIVLSAILNVYLLPRDVPGNRAVKVLVMVLQWILLPVVLIIFGSIPVLDAQTRLFLGRYLGFYTAKKVRNQQEEDEKNGNPTDPEHTPRMHIHGGAAQDDVV